MIGMLKFHSSMSDDDRVNTLNQNFSEIEGNYNQFESTHTRIVSSGNISAVGAKLSIALGVIQVNLERKDANDSKLSLQPLIDKIKVDVTHKQITGTTVTSVAIENTQYTTKTDIVATIANDSNGTTNTLIRDIPNGRTWEVKTFISGNGSRATLWAERID